MKYTCLKCNKFFNKKSNYQKHLDRKRPCDNNLINNNCLKSGDLLIIDNNKMLHGRDSFIDPTRLLYRMYIK